MKELREKSEEELERELVQKRAALRSFRFNLAGSKTRNLKEGRNLRKDIARILTETNRRRMRNANIKN